MESNELRIGNLVEYDNRIFEIDSVAKEFPTLNTIEFGIGVVDWNNIKPTPLTEEWLYKFGFIKEGFIDGTYNFFHENMYGNNCLLPTGDGFELLIGNTEIFYVHQLQNLCFALTGKELELKKATN